MAFHVCFVEVCDGSVLLDGKDIGKNAAINVNLLGLDVIEAAKTAVEAVCPGVVSCADIFANAARDSTVKLNGAGGVVQGGRKDDTVPTAAPAKNDLPLPPFDVSQLIDSFAKRDHSTEQMVIV
ncbi:peroxidase [Marchantia polymorpha subsp. ruderalis]